MKVKWKLPTSFLECTNGKVYEVLETKPISIDNDKIWYRIIDDTEEDYWYPSGCFDVVE